jgi:LEA14-like dessication related protein
MALQSKMTVYVAIVGVFAMMGGIIYYASLGNAELEQAEIELSSVELIDNGTTEDQIKFNVTFLVKNPSDTTFTVSVIEYNLYNNGVLLGSGKYSTEDVSMPGRASFFPNTEIPLNNIFVLNKADVGSEIFQSATENTHFSAEGIITIQTTWTVSEKEFKSRF